MDRWIDGRPLIIFPILHGAALFLVVTSVQLCAFKQLASHLLELAPDVLLPIESTFLKHGNIVLMRCALGSLVSSHEVV